MAVLTADGVADAARLLADAPSPVVVIPVYEAHEDVVRCLRAVVAHTDRAVAVLVVDDGGADRRSAQLLAAHAAHIQHRVVVLTHAANQGYVRSCNEAFAATPGRDVVLLNSDVIVGPDWLARLTAAALSSDLIATATTLTNHGTIVSVPYRNNPVRDLPGQLTPAEAARRVAAASRRLRPEIPTGIGHCLYVRRPVLDLIGPFDESFTPGYGEEVDFCQRAVAHGYRHVVADDVFTFHRGAAAFGTRADVIARRARHEDLIRHRYPWYGPWVERVERDQLSDLATALAAARRALIGLTVGVDGLCLGPDRMGTQVNTLESIRALAARPEIARLVVFVPVNIGQLVQELRAELPRVEFIGITLAAGIPDNVVDIMYRPYQVREPIELDFLHTAGERFVVNQLDTIAYDNPAYFGTAQAWFAYRDLTRLTLQLASGVAFLSEHGRLTCRAAGLLPPGQPSAVVSCGTDGEFAAPFPVDRSDPPGGPGEIRPGFLLCLGASYLHKNRPFALEVWAELRRRGWPGQLVLAGPTPPFGNSTAVEADFLLGEPDLAGDVVELGAVSNAHKRWLYEQCAMVLYPSTVEGFGLVPFEAARYGAATLATRCGSLDETLPAGIPVLDCFDVIAAADRLWPLLVDPDARGAAAETPGAAADLAAALLARAADFTWAGVAERLVALFAATLDRPQSRVLELAGDGPQPIGVTGKGAVGAANQRARRLESLVQGVIERPGLKRVLSPDGSRRQHAARTLIDRARQRLR